MAPPIDTEDLIDATEVAEILGLSQRNSVGHYQRCQSDMPRPLVERADGRIKLWSRREIERWGGPEVKGEPAGNPDARGESDTFALVGEGAEVIAHLTTRHAVELIACGAGDKERAIGENLLLWLKGDPEKDLSFAATVVIPPKANDLVDPGAVVAVRIPDLDDEDSLFTLRINELSPALEAPED